MTIRDGLRSLAQRHASGELEVDVVWDAEAGSLDVSISKEHRAYERPDPPGHSLEILFAPPVARPETVDEVFAALIADVPDEVLDRAIPSRPAAVRVGCDQAARSTAGA